MRSPSSHASSTNGPVRERAAGAADRRRAATCSARCGVVNGIAARRGTPRWAARAGSRAARSSARDDPGAVRGVLAAITSRGAGDVGEDTPRTASRAVVSARSRLYLKSPATTGVPSENAMPSRSENVIDEAVGRDLPARGEPRHDQSQRRRRVAGA